MFTSGRDQFNYQFKKKELNLHHNIKEGWIDKYSSDGIYFENIISEVCE